MKSTRLILALTLAVPFFAVGCAENNGTDTSENNVVNGDSTEIQYTDNSAIMGKAFSMKLANPSNYVSFDWKLTDTQNQNVEGCSGTGTSTVSCTLDVSGAVVVSVDTVDQKDNRKHFQRTINVIQPPSNANQAPRVIIGLYSMNSTVAIAETSATGAIADGSFNVPTGSYVIKISATDDRDAASDLGLEMDFNGTGFHGVSASTAINLPNVGVIPVKIRVTDKDGAPTTREFSLYTKCATANLVAIHFNSPAVSASAPTKRNFYDLTASVTGGNGPLKYQFDVNGDGIFDNDWISTPTKNFYNAFNGLRSVGVKVWDTQCNQFAQITTPITYNITKANPAAPAVDANYYYLQAVVSAQAGQSAVLSKVQNVDLVVNHKKSDPVVPMRVSCDYRKSAQSSASLTVTGYNRYGRSGQYQPASYQPDTDFSHGLGLKFENISDNDGYQTTGVANISTSAAQLTRADYYTDGGYDTFQRYDHQKNAACTFSLTINPMGAGASPCSNSGSHQAYALQFLGKFSCPDLRDSSGSSRVSVSQGAFYCEVAAIDACEGGGGGGGGVDPTPR